MAICFFYIYYACLPQSSSDLLSRSVLATQSASPLGKTNHRHRHAACPMQSCQVCLIFGPICVSISKTLQLCCRAPSPIHFTLAICRQLRIL